MGNRNRMQWVLAIIVFSIIVAASNFSALGARAGVAAPVTEKVLNGNGENGLYSSKEILQFRSGGLILGFREDRMYMVGMGYALIEEFVGAKKVKPLAGGGGQAENKEGKGAPAFHGVTYPGLWEGIDLRYKAREGELAESVFEIRPHADPEKIMLKYNAEVEVQKDGSLKLTPPGKKGYFTMSAPKAWQEIRDKRVSVAVAFRKVKDNTVGFKVAEYNREYPLVIDPSYQWHTFYGSGADDWGYAIAVDGSGNVYVTGWSDATWNGPAGQGPLHAHSGLDDIFVLKLNGAGAYQWHTFYGSPNYDYGSDIAVDGSENVYVTGGSFATWNGPSGQAPLHAHSGYWDIFVLKLNSYGTYQWHTFYGSAYLDEAHGIAVDGSGNVYVTGESDTTWDGPSGQSPLHAYRGGGDIFVLKLNSYGTYQWHTFYGSGGCEYGGIAVDASGSVYVTGQSSDTWDGPSGQSPLHAHSGGSDIFVLKLNSAGAYQWHTFYGSGDLDKGDGIAVDGSGNVYVTGGSWGTWNGPSGQAPLHAHSGYWDIFVLKLNSYGTYQWHTFYGSAGTDYGPGIIVDGSGNIHVTDWTGTDHGSGIVVDASGNIYVTGESYTTWDGPSGESPLHAHSGYWDIFVLKLNSYGTYQWHTFYGSAYGDGGDGIAVDGSGNVYVTGWSYDWNGPSGQSPLHAYSGDYDIVVLKMRDGAQKGGYFTITGIDGLPLTDKAVNEEFQIKVTAKHANGLTDTTWNGQVMLSATNGGLSSNSIYLTNGIGTKTVSIRLPGSGVKIKASGGGMSGVSNTFNVGSMCTGSISGTVKRYKTSLGGATVYLMGDSGLFSTTSVTNGNFSFDNVPSGNYILWAQYSDDGRSDDIPVYVSCGSITRDINVYSACNSSGKTPVLLVPGIMGSTLKENPIELIPTLHNKGFIEPHEMELYDGRATDRGWEKLRNMLEAHGYTQDCTLFDVPYDWRLDIRDIVDKYLIPAIDKAKKVAGSEKVNIIAHSMGGLVTREYIQGPSYRGDIDRFAMIGTPNHGSANAYPLWEGGDPFTADFIAGHPLPVYTLVVAYLAAGELKTVSEVNKCWLLAGIYDSLHCIAESESYKYNKANEYKNYIAANVKSVGQLMPTYLMLDTPTGLEKVECPGMPNDWLDQLNSNNLSRFTNYNDNDPSKVRTMLFIGEHENTVLKLKVARKNCSRRLYPDGFIFWFDREQIGDGTVLKSSAELPGIDAKYKKGEHAKLVGVFAPEVVDFITGGDGVVTTQALKAYRSISAAVAPTKSLSIATHGTVRPLIITPFGEKIGIENGLYVNEAPDRTQVNIGIDSGGIKIEDPPDGTYTVILADTVARDYKIAISFSDSSGSPSMVAAHGFNHAGTLSFTFTLDSTSSGNQIIINHTPPPLTGLQADAVNSGGLKTRLTWTASTSPDIDHYNIYSRYDDEPYLTMIGTSSTNLYDTGDPWAIDSSIKTRVYAVSAVRADGTESFLSNMAENNDQDHDGLTDALETELSTNPSKPDSDGDGLKDGEEYLLGTNPLLVDTDGDGFSDYEEVQAGSDPLDAASTPKRLTVTKTGGGSGTVNATGCTLSWDGNVGTCSAIAGTQITLTGTADAGSTFAGWSGGTGPASTCKGIGPCSFSLSADASLTAQFIRGDINRDGKVDISDVILCLRQATGIFEKDKGYDLGDMNGDFLVDIRDAMIMLRKIANSE